MNLSTRLLVTGPDDQILAFRDKVRDRLDLMEDQQPETEGAAFFWVEVLRLQWAIRQARQFGLDARESVVGERGGAA